jgi:hypothetical protein
VGAEVLAQRGVGDSESYRPQICTVHRPTCAGGAPSFGGIRPRAALGRPDGGRS